MKQTFTTAARHSAGILPLSQWIKISRQKIFLPFYHAIQGTSALPHIHHLYTLRSKQAFEKDLDYLLCHFEPLDLSQLLAISQQRKAIKQPSFFLSFDDGLREVYDIAAPVLLKKGIPASIFLNSAFIDNKQLFFRYKASLLIEHLQQKENSPTEIQAIADLLQLKNPSIENIVSALLKITYDNKNNLDLIAEILNFSFEHFLAAKQPYLSSSQIKKLQSDGFTFGSHSIDHPLYHRLSLEEQLYQTKTSLDFIQQQFNPTIKSFSFPFTDYGVSAAFFERVKQEQLLDISFGCAGLKKEQFAFHFQRFAMEGNNYPASKLVAGEYFSYIVKSLFGKNRIKEW